jgi:NAD(P)-dependent dehydrogenase (short-subunit alcohol dehydrogenase family)
VAIKIVKEVGRGRIVGSRPADGPGSSGRRHRVEAAAIALSFRPVAGLAEVQEPGCSGREAPGGRGLGVIRTSSLFGFAAFASRSNSTLATSACSSAIGLWRYSRSSSVELWRRVKKRRLCCRGQSRGRTRFGRVDGLIHCAAIHSSRFWTELEADELNRVLAVNVTGSFLIAKAAAEHMVKNKTGAIVLTSSSNVITGGVGGAAGLGGPAYVASKAAIIGLVRSLGPNGIRVNGISPGVTDTPMIANYSTEHRAVQVTRSALGHIAEPDEIAGVACFLTTPAARYVTGEVVIVNGGSNFG